MKEWFKTWALFVKAIKTGFLPTAEVLDKKKAAKIKEMLLNGEI